jgi:hypothetical protein
MPGELTRLSEQYRRYRSAWDGRSAWVERTSAAMKRAAGHAEDWDALKVLVEAAAAYVGLVEHHWSPEVVLRLEEDVMRAVRRMAGLLTPPDRPEPAPAGGEEPNHD